MAPPIENLDLKKFCEYGPSIFMKNVIRYFAVLGKSPGVLQDMKKPQDQTDS